MIDRRLDGINHRFADLECELRLGSRKAFRRILVANARARHAALELAAPARGIRRDPHNARFAEPEDDAALQLRGRVVEVDDRARGATQALERAFDELAAALCKHLDGDVVRDQISLDEETDEVVVGLRRGWETDLYLLEADLEQDVPEAPLALWIHGVDERLIAVPKVDAAPQRRPVDALVRPGTVPQLQRKVGPVFLVRHPPGDDRARRHVGNDAISAAVAVPASFRMALAG